MSTKETLQTRLDIETLYNKGRKNIVLDQQHNKDVINLLKYAQIITTQLQNHPQKNGQTYSLFHKSFKNLRSKMISVLNEIGEQAGEMGQAVRKVLNQIIDELGAKARRYQQSEKRMKQLGRMHVQTQEQHQQLQEAVKQEMIELLVQFKNQARQMSKDLQKDNKVIQNINAKQQKVQKSLKKQTDNVKELNKSNPLGFLSLIGYGVVAVFLWIITLMFILFF